MPRQTPRPRFHSVRRPQYATAQQVAGRVRRASNQRQHGFTLVELLVVITIIGVLMSLLIPVVGRVREAAHRVACINNQKQIGLAMTLYATSKGKMPPALVTFNDPLASNAPYTLGWAENLMSQLGRPDLAPGTLAVATLRSTLPEFALLVCPSDPTKVGEAKIGPLSYVVNAGCPMSTSATPYDWNQNGAWNLFTGSNTQNTNRTLEYIARHDGTSTTISHSENLDAVSYSYGTVAASSGNVQQTESGQAILWFPGQTSSTPVNAYPSTTTTYPPGTIDSGGGNGNTALARPSSNHPGGAVFAFCDGSVKFIQQTMSYNVYATLMTSYGAQAGQPGGAAGSYVGTQVIPLDSSQIPTN